MSQTSSKFDMFEVAARTKLRFPSAKGELSVENLWDVPLRSRDDLNLDIIAKTINKTVKTLSEESYVETSKTAAQERSELALDLVKYVIGVKLDEEAIAKKRAENKVKKAKLLQILAEKKDSKLSDLSEKELLKQINDLDD